MGDFIAKVKLINFGTFDEFVVNKIKESVQPLQMKFEKFFGEKSLFDLKLTVEKIHEDAGGKTQYEVIGFMNTKIGRFRTTERGWNIINIVDEVVKDLTRLITEKKEKIKWKRNSPANA